MSTNHFNRANRMIAGAPLLARGGETAIMEVLVAPSGHVL